MKYPCIKTWEVPLTHAEKKALVVNVYVRKEEKVRAKLPEYPSEGRKKEKLISKDTTTEGRKE